MKWQGAALATMLSAAVLVRGAPRSDRVSDLHARDTRVQLDLSTCSEFAKGWTDTALCIENEKDGGTTVLPTPDLSKCQELAGYITGDPDKTLTIVPGDYSDAGGGMQCFTWVKNLSKDTTFTASRRALGAFIADWSKKCFSEGTGKKFNAVQCTLANKKAFVKIIFENKAWRSRHPGRA